MSSGKKFKRGFLDGFYEIFQKDPFIVKMSGVTQENEDKNEDANAKKTLDKRTLSVFVARKIRDNYMDICASLPWKHMKEPADFIFQYLKEPETSAFFDRKPQQSLLSAVFDSFSIGEEMPAAYLLFERIIQHIQDTKTPCEIPFEPANDQDHTQSFIRALGELRAASEPYEKDAVDGRGEKYALLTECKKILKRTEKETESPSQKDFVSERFMVSKTLRLCFESDGYGKAWWKRWFEILCVYPDQEALQIATTEAFLNLVIEKLFQQKQIEAKYRNMGDGRDLSKKPQTKNVFAQDITFKDVCETYYINRFLLSMEAQTEQAEKDEEKNKQRRRTAFETLLRYHAAYISTASTSRFPAETGRLFSGTTSATGKNTQRTKQLLSIFAFLYFHTQFQSREDGQNASENFRRFNHAARITVDEKSVFHERDLFANGFDAAQRKYLLAIHDCINAVQRDFLYIFEKTQRVINAPTREQFKQDEESSKEKSVAQYMKSIMNKLTELHKGGGSRDGDVALLKKNAENIIRVCEEYSLHIPDSLIENAMKEALKYEKKKTLPKEDADQTENVQDGDTGENLENPENMAQYFMNECLKSLEEKFNEAAEKDFLCNQLLLRQDFDSVRLLLFRFARYNDFTNECVLDIDLLKMRNELLENIDDVLIIGNDDTRQSKYSVDLQAITDAKNRFSMTFANEIFERCFFRNLIEMDMPCEQKSDENAGAQSDPESKLDTESFCRILALIEDKAKTRVLEKNSPTSYRFICDLDRLILAGVGFARKYDGDQNIGDPFSDVFKKYFQEYGTEHLDYYFDPFILFGTVAISYLSDETRKHLIRYLCEEVRKNRTAGERPLQEGYILLLNHVLLQVHISLSYYERKAIFDCIFATNMYPKQWQAYEKLKERSFYADYARQEYQYFLDGVVQSPRFIYLAASEAPEIPEEKINQGEFKFDLTKALCTVDAYYDYCLRFQYLSWTQSKHTVKAECVAQIVTMGRKLSDDILNRNDRDKRKFALGTQMLLMGISNLIRSDRLKAEDAKKIPYHVFHKELVDIMIRSEYLQRKMNEDYQKYLNQDASLETAPLPTFWMLCGGLRYVAAIRKEPRSVPDYRVELQEDEAAVFANSLNPFASRHLKRFYGMDHRLIDCFTDYFEKRPDEKSAHLDCLLDGTKAEYLAYDNMENYESEMAEERKKLKDNNV